MAFPSPLYLFVFGCAYLPALVYGLNQTYCSSQNTGSGEPYYWLYQSNGWCHDKCDGSYAFAIVKKYECWCSNYIPAVQLSVSKCSDECPGFNEESCGNSGSGLYGYIELDKNPSGTAAAPYSAPATSKPVQQSTSAQVSTTSPFSSEVPSSSPSPSPSPSSSWTPTPITSIQVVTESGSYITKTVTIMPTAPGGETEHKNKSVSGGAIAGAVVGSLAGLAAIVGLIVWILARRRRRLNDEEYDNDGSALARSSPQRHASTMSKSGLLRSEKHHPAVAIPAPVYRNGSNGTDGISPISGSHGSTSERRNSKPLFYDQRLNPSALMDLDNGSHTSIITIEDNRDYTRTLNVRNPDPPEQQP